MSVPVLSLPNVVADKVRPGRSIYLGNFGSQLFSVGQEIIRQEITGLDVVIASGGLLLDQLLGARCVRSATFGHCWSPVGPSPAWNFRRLAEGGDTETALHEMSLGMMAAGLTAGAWGVPFMPVPGLAGTGFLTEDWSNGMLAQAQSPWGACNVVAAITPDVAFIHVDRCDERGNGWIPGPLGEVSLAAAAAAEVVLVAEEMVDTETLRAGGITIPGVRTAAVTLSPGAVSPDGAIGRYDRDVAAYEEYARVSSTEAGFNGWLAEVRRPQQTGGGGLE